MYLFASSFLTNDICRKNTDAGFEYSLGSIGLVHYGGEHLGFAYWRQAFQLLYFLHLPDSVHIPSFTSPVISDVSNPHPVVPIPMCSKDGEVVPLIGLHHKHE